MKQTAVKDTKTLGYTDAASNQPAVAERVLGVQT